MIFYTDKEKINCTNCTTKLRFQTNGNVFVAICCNKYFMLENVKKGYNVTQYSRSVWNSLKDRIPMDELTVESLSPSEDEIVDEETISLLNELESNKEDLNEEQKTDDIEAETDEATEEVISPPTTKILDDVSFEVDPAQAA